MPDLALIWLIILLEASGEPAECQALAVDVSIARTTDRNFPDTLRGVLSQPGQYPWWKHRFKLAASMPAIDAQKAAVAARRYQYRPTTARFFFNPGTAAHDPMPRLPVLFKCGHHNFK